ncbi:hypothetical protein [Paenibacillus sonchi]|uniref:hypothetical protein n=1 Tax=Paenibacillus sonchi TaxID=373687 RepID=UPI001F3AC001|nr:hypothetical protein [Paenibacillus sonchi]
MTKRKFASMLMLTAMLAGVLAGCGNSNSNNEESKQPANSASAETPYIEFWTVNDQGYKNFEKDGPTSQQIIKDVGVGIYAPVVAWDGGTTICKNCRPVSQAVISPTCSSLGTALRMIWLSKVLWLI